MVRALTTPVTGMRLMDWNAHTASSVSAPKCPSTAPGSYLSAARRRCTDLTAAPDDPSDRVPRGGVQAAGAETVCAAVALAGPAVAIVAADAVPAAYALIATVAAASAIA